VLKPTLWTDETNSPVGSLRTLSDPYNESNHRYAGSVST
jgi:hypothetical protein